jgi:hypothetical protein
LLAQGAQVDRPGAERAPGVAYLGKPGAGAGAFGDLGVEASFVTGRDVGALAPRMTFIQMAPNPSNLTTASHPPIEHRSYYRPSEARAATELDPLLCLAAPRRVLKAAVRW